MTRRDFAGPGPRAQDDAALPGGAIAPPAQDDNYLDLYQPPGIKSSNYNYLLNVIGEDGRRLEVYRQDYCPAKGAPYSGRRVISAIRQVGQICGVVTVVTALKAAEDSEDGDGSRR